MKRFATIFLMLAAVLLSGCLATTKVVTRTEYVVVKPADDLIRTCDLSELPPAKNEYLAADLQRREQMLADYAARLQKEFSKCNLRWESLKEWYVKQEANYVKKE